ncbi:MAG: family 20 glycosylhydrolase [Prevotella sp.]|nr:family 20 glycosylhydrolase [Prevotella sp.]
MKRTTRTAVWLIACLCLALAQGLAQTSTAQAPALIPAPQTVSWGTSSYVLPATCRISYTVTSLNDAATYLAQSIEQSDGSTCSVVQGRNGDIRLSLSSKLAKAGAYSLTISNQGIDIVGRDYEGITNGIATLRQLLLQQGTTLTSVTISDAPCYGWRGFMLDSSRHFWSVDEVKHIVDIMALYKLNRFHWHLTDDQGWRIEIKKYPLLTERGAWRIFNNQDTACWQRAAKTDNPDMLLPQQRLRIADGDTLYGGFYTQKDIRDVVAYARQRGIEIMPEIDMPGHFLSAIEHYEGLSCFPQAGWGEWFTTPLCPGKQRVLDFCQDIWREVVALFPYKYVHVGGDEVRRDTWEKCPDCQQRIKDENLKDEDELQAWFMRQMEQFLNKQGRQIMGWDEILEGGLSPTATVTWWRTWVPDAPQRALKQGNDVVFCPGSPMYLSQGEENNSIHDIYEYALPGKSGKPGESGESGKPGKPGKSGKSGKPGHPGRILGVQANLWTEYIPTIERAFYMYFPRIMALSELAWSTPEQKDFANFTARQPQHFLMLQKLGIPYRSPAPEGFYSMNAFTKEGILDAICNDPTVLIRYTTDGTIPTVKSPLYTKPIKVSETTHFALRTFMSDGRGGETVYTDFVKQGFLEPITVIGLDNLATPENSKKVNGHGLRADWHEFRGYKCDKMHLTPVRQTFDIDDVCIPKGVSGHIGLIITGYLQVPTDGIYTFALKSDDGSLLKIDGNMVVDNDQPQSPHEEIGQQALRAGLHTIEVRYYDHNGGMLRLHVLGPDGQRLSPADIYRRN